MFKCSLVLILSIATMAVAASKTLSPVNVNSVPADSLFAHLPGVGPAIASQIVAARADSAFRSCEDLAARVKGLGAKKTAKICPLATF